LKVTGQGTGHGGQCKLYTATLRANVKHVDVKADAKYLGITDC